MDDRKYKQIIGMMAVLLIAVVLVAFFGFRKLDQNFNELQNLVRFNEQKLGNMQAEVSDLRLYLEEEAIRRSSIIDSFSLEAVETDVDKLTIKLKFTVIPKEYTYSTTANFYVNDTSTMMLRNGNVYTAEMKFPMTEEITQISVSFTQNGVTRSETISVDYAEVNFALLFTNTIQANLETSVTPDGSQYKIGGRLHYTFASAVDTSPVSEELIAVIDGVEAMRMDLAGGLKEKEIFDGNGPVISEGQTVLLKIRAVDDKGFTYEADLSRYTLKDTLFGEEHISNGNLVYGRDGELLFGESMEKR